MLAYCGPREEKNIDFGWKFHLGDIAGAESPALDDADWRTVDLPHDFQIELFDSTNGIFEAIGGLFVASGIFAQFIEMEKFQSHFSRVF